MLTLLLTLTLFQAQESPHYEGWLIIEEYAGACEEAYENLGAMAFLTWENQRPSGYVYFDDGTIARVEGNELTFPAAVASEAERYTLDWQQEKGRFKVTFTPVHQGQDPCAWKQAFLRLTHTNAPGPSQQEWINEYQAMTLMTEVVGELAQGITTDAFPRLRQALTLSPHHEDIHASVAWLFRQTDPSSLIEALMEEAEKATKAGQLDLAYALKATLVLALSFAGYQAFKDKDYEKALGLYQEALELIPNHHQALANAGYACDWLDRDDQARTLFQKAVTAATATGQIKFSAKAISHNAISRYHAVLSSLLEITPDWAEEKSRMASALPDTPTMAEAREQWAGLNRQVISSLRNGQYTRGLALAAEALVLAEKHFGKNHPDYFVSLNNLAALYDSQGAYDRAQPLFEQALLLHRDVLGERHPHTLTSINNLANLYKSQGAYDRAQPLFEQALLLRRDVLGQRHPQTLTSINNLAFLYGSSEIWVRVMTARA